MKIVVLDGYVLNPGDLDWGGLRALGNCTIHERTAPELTAERAAGADILLTNKTVLPGDLIARLEALRYVGVLATGYNVVDMEAARARGVVVTNVPGYSTDSVAQHVMALLLELARGVGLHATLVRQGRWAASADFSFWAQDQVELTGLRLGVIGFGSIGRAVARLAQAFGMEVWVHTRHPQHHQQQPTAANCRFVDLDQLFAGCDVVSLHCPLTDETLRLVDAERLARMKKGAWLINTGRGPLVDEEALAAALHKGEIAGAALDVLAVEPPPPGHPLLTAPNCLVTPHIAWATRAARQRLLQEVISNLQTFLQGGARNVVS
jgi:glycerate dehydrogenase